MAEKLVYIDNYNVLKILYALQSYRSACHFTQGQKKGNSLYLRNINLFTKDLAWSPVDSAQKLDIEMDLPLNFKDVHGRLSFDTEALHIHGQKMLISRFPTTIEVMNTRKDERINCLKEKENKLKFFSVGEVNYQGNPTHISGQLMDFSSQGIGIKVERSELIVGVGEPIQLQLDEDKAFLQKVKGRIRSKVKSFTKSPGEKSFYRLGVELEKPLPLDECMDVFL